jgi:putative acetyltransferase
MGRSSATSHCPGHITDDQGKAEAGTVGADLRPAAKAGHGIGSRLMEQALSELRAMQAAGCVLLGDPAYYGRFGLQLPGVPPGYFCTGPAWASARRHRAYSDAFNAAA